MSVMRCALAQVNPTVGDLRGNCDMVVENTRHAVAAGAQIVAFPEMVVTGYPVEDLALRTSFMEASRAALAELATDLHAAGLGDVPVVVGYLGRSEPSAPAAAVGEPQHRDAEHGGAGAPHAKPQNCAAILHGGRVVTRYAKHHLPNYGVFDEFRVFAPGQALTVTTVGGVDVALAICEDIWQDGGPVAAVASTDAQLLIVLNGSPYERHKDDTRLRLVRRRAAETGCAVAYVNLVGGQDDLVFDGDSIIVDAEGAVVARAAQFTEDLLIADVPLPAAGARGSVTESPFADTVRRTSISGHAPDASAPPVALRGTVATPLDDTAEVYHALVVGLRDYVRKNGFSSVVLGLSGGIDSALVATLAADAIGGSRVVGVSMPSVYSSDHSVTDAEDLARRIGCDYRTVPIKPMVDAFSENLTLGDVAAENIQARVRGMILMGISNSEGPLVLATSNKSEMSVGYSTIYGDSVGGFAPLKDVPKTLVWQLARWRNDQESDPADAPIPTNSITKPPSAELRPGQRDDDSLPDYDVLDAILVRYVEQAQGRDELIDDGFRADLVDQVVTLVDRAEWKRRQSAPGTKITGVAFGRDRRLPITSAWREHLSRSADQPTTPQ